MAVPVVAATVDPAAEMVEAVVAAAVSNVVV
jgi:hypothetical protein